MLPENQQPLTPQTATEHNLHSSGIRNQSFSGQKKKLALFDFDGTITTRNTMTALLLYYCGPVRFFAGLLWLSPMLVQYLLKRIPNWRAKEKMLQYFIGGETLENFNGRCTDFCTRILPSMIRKEALKKIEQLRNEGDTIIVVSASAENWVKPWCDAHKLLCVATRLEVVNGLVTGKLCGKNCYGPEKVNRLCNAIPLSDYDEIFMYGDSAGDRELFSIAHQRFFKPFRS